MTAPLPLLFRAKNEKTGKWQFGYFTLSQSLIPYKMRGWIHTPKGMVPVDSNTVGQFIGMYDMKHKRIFVGDKVELENEDGETIIAIIRSGIFRRFVSSGNNKPVEVDIAGFCFELPNGKQSFPIVNNYAGKHDLNILKVIGSIHDVVKSKSKKK